MRRASSSKYRNIKTVVDGHVFASGREARRYSELRLLERAKKISHLVLQPPFECIVRGVHVCTYIADFQYVILGDKDYPCGMIVTEDVKGYDTPISRLKRKLVKACRGISVKVIQ